MLNGKLMANITQTSDLDGLTHLKPTKAQSSRKLETFPNHHQERNYKVSIHTNEFTCLCPVTGQPDFAQLTIRYIPDHQIIESKSLKMYLWSYRDEPCFHEHVTNTILDDLVSTLAPRWCKVTAEFSIRGGISITVEAEHPVKED